MDLDRELEIAIARFNRSGLILPEDLCLYFSLGLQRIEPDGDLYQPTDHGPLASIVPVYAGRTPSFMTPICEDPGLIDLIAFRFGEPSRWWRRTGHADYLGEYRIRSVVTWDEPLQVFATPLAWLNSRGDGVCPLTSDYSALRDPRELRFEDETFAGRVRRALSHPFPIPRILVKVKAA